jgi:hypothetical protein
MRASISVSFAGDEDGEGELVAPGRARGAAIFFLTVTVKGSVAR